MPGISNAQTDFRGGLWSPSAQGRFDDPRYKTALNESFNGFPVQEGRWNRRPGFRVANHTRGYQPALLHPLSVIAAPSHALEFTSGHMRLFQGANIVMDDERQVVSSFSTANPTVCTTSAQHGWNNGDGIIFRVEGITSAGIISDLAPILQRELSIAVIDAFSFYVYNSETGRGLDGSLIDFDNTDVQLSVGRITDFSTPYVNDDWAGVDIAQNDTDAFLLHGSYQPQDLTIKTAQQPFTVVPAEFQDGPYLDQISGVVATVTQPATWSNSHTYNSGDTSTGSDGYVYTSLIVSNLNHDPTSDDGTHWHKDSTALTGVINLSFSYTAWDATIAYSIGDFVGVPGTAFGYQSLIALNQNNNPAASPTAWKQVSNLTGFANKGAGITEEDIGRHIRIQSEPPLWLTNTTYAVGANVTMGTSMTDPSRQYWTCISAVTKQVVAIGVTDTNQPGIDPTLWVPNPNAMRFTWGVIVRSGPPVQSSSVAAWTMPGYTLTQDCGRLNADGTPKAPYTYASPINDLSQVGACWYPNWLLDHGEIGSTGGTIGDADFPQSGSFSTAAIVYINVAVQGSGTFGSISCPNAQVWTRNAGYSGAPSKPVYTVTSVGNQLQEGVPGTPIGNMTGGAGLSALFRPGTLTTFASNPGNTGYAGLQLLTPASISSGRIYPVDIAPGGASALGFTLNGFTRAITVNMWAKATLPANEHDGTLLGSTTVAGPVTSSAPIVVASTDPTTYSYVWFEIVVTSDFDTVASFEPFGGTFRFGPFSQFSVAASKISFFTDANNPAGAQIGVQLKGDPLLYTGLVTNWLLGRYNNHEPNWPTHGAFFEDRLYLSSGVTAHVDASCANGNLLDMAPTLPDGTITDASSLSFDLMTESNSPINWLKAEIHGVLVGTTAQEFIIHSPGETGPITPTARAADPSGAFGTAPVLPIATTIGHVFVQKNKRDVYELFRDVYSGQLTSVTMSEFSQGLANPGLVRLAYQRGLSPIIWAQTEDGRLIATTYRRDHRFSYQPPTFNGWSRHAHGAGRSIISLCMNSGVTGDLDAPTIISQGEDGKCYVEVMGDLMVDTDNVYASNYLDSSITPHSASFYSGGVYLYGLWPLEGKTVKVLLAGLDCGSQYPVLNGTVTVPFKSDSGGLLTQRYLTELTGIGQDFADLTVMIDGQCRAPCLVGFDFTSQGQRLRPMEAAETGKQNGPALGAFRRNNKFAMLATNTRNVLIGTDFGRMHKAQFASPGGRVYTPTELWNGIFWDTIDDDSTVDGMICWQSSGPFPVNISAIGGYVETQ